VLHSHNNFRRFLNKLAAPIAMAADFPGRRIPKTTPIPTNQFPDAGKASPVQAPSTRNNTEKGRSDERCGLKTRFPVAAKAAPRRPVSQLVVVFPAGRRMG
jgi:hypothetical protein